MHSTVTARAKNTGGCHKNQALAALGLINRRVMDCVPVNDTLFGGQLSLAFYLVWLHGHTRKYAHKHAAVSALENVLVAFNQNTARLSGPFYCNGFAGLLYALTLFVKRGLIDDDIMDDACFLAEQVSLAAVAGIEQDYNDMVHGSFGSLHVLTAHARLTGELSAVNAVLRKIEQQYLFKSNPWIPTTTDGPADYTTVNFSLSHGQCGMLTVLLDAYSIVGCSKKAQELLMRNIDFVLEHYNEKTYGDTYNHFPSMYDVVNNSYKTSQRLAWCYGDLGPVLLLYKAAAFFNSPVYFAAAEKAGLLTTKRLNVESTLLKQSQICHGAGGVAQLYKALTAYSGQKAYEDAYQFWVGEMLGFLNDELNKPLQASVLDIAEGLSGAGLVLMSYLSRQPLPWSEIMFI